MSDIADACPPKARRIKTRPDRQPLDTRPNPEPTVAFGFVLDNQYRIRWAKDFLEEYQKQKACTFTPEECEEKIPSLTFALITTIPSLVYRALPDVPRIRNNLLPVEHPELGFEDFVFALRDNSTVERFHSPLTPENIAAVRKELGLPDGQQPKWVRITVARSSRPPRTRRVVDFRPNPEPTLAFGFVLDHECRQRWANKFMQEYEDSGDDTFTPEQLEAIKEGLLFAVIAGVPERIYHVLPDIPRVRKQLLPVVHPELGFDDFVFVLRDNSTIQRLHSPLTQENIEAIRKALGLPDDQEPKWVRIPIF